MTAGAEPEAERDLSRRNVRLGAVVLAVLAGMVGISLLRGSPSSGGPELTGALRASLEQDGCTVDSAADGGQAHVPAATYSVNPPAGGDHDSAPSPAGFYDMTDAPTDGHTALAATAWHRRLLCPDGADGPVGTFVTTFRNQGPEKGFVQAGPDGAPQRTSRDSRRSARILPPVWQAGQ